MKKSNTYKILSVGGSIVIPTTGFDISFLKKFRALIVAQVKAGQKFILVIGGGATARQYQAAGRRLGWKNRELDWVGIYATVLNANFMRLLFGNLAHSEIVINPTKKVKTTKPIIIASGWRPGCSTDKDAVLLAKTYGAKEVINLSNVDYIYDSDPKNNPAAKRFTQLTWKELRGIVGKSWAPGANVPFDPEAAKVAEKFKFIVRFVRGTNLALVRRALDGKNALGTIIS